MKPAAGVGVVGLQGFQDVLEGDPVLEQGIRIGHHVELLDEAPEAIDLIDARQAAQLRGDQPVLERAKAGQVILALDQLCLAILAASFHPRPGIRMLRAVEPRFQGVLVDLAQAGGDRPHLRLGSLGQTVLGLGQPFEDDLPGEVRVNVVLENDYHLRQAGLGGASDLPDLGQTAHFDLDRHRDEALDLAGRQAGRLRQDHHLYVGGVGERIDRQLLPGQDASHQQKARGQDHHEPLLEGELQ